MSLGGRIAKPIIARMEFRERKLWKGRVRQWRNGQGPDIDRESWWNANVYATDSIDDQTTVGEGVPELKLRFHYAGVEQRVCQALLEHGVDPTGIRTLDIGSGAGHWLAFMRSLGAGSCHGVEGSTNAVAHLRQRFKDDPAIQVTEGFAPGALESVEGPFDVATAIGVLFHLVDHDHWQDTLTAIGERMPSGGLFVIGGLFQRVGTVDIQWDKEGHTNKRVRSMKRYKAALKKAGFSQTVYYPNPHPKNTGGGIPENNILVAIKD